MEKPLIVGAAVGLLVLLAQCTWRIGPARVLRTLGCGLAWDEPQSVLRLPGGDSALWWLAHAAGLAYLWRLAGRSYASALPLGLASAALLLLPQWPALLRGKRADVAVLTSLALPYVAGLAYGLDLVPDPLGAALLQMAELAATGYVVLVQLERGRGARWLPRTTHLVLAAVGLWGLVEYLGGRTHGVTGSDPYCYAQMAVDLARRGDLRHAFSLVPLVRDLGIPWWPLVHVGYHVPDGATGLAATVWPVGWPVLLAGGYRLLGERGLYLTAPIAGLLALVATAALAWMLWPERPRERALGMALALLILATSREQVLQLLVPMADVPAQLFTVLAVWLALCARRRGSWGLAGLAGVALGVAYDIRHTQVFLAPVLALALWPPAGPVERRRTQGRSGTAKSFASFTTQPAWRWVWLVAAAGLGAWVAAAPDLWYHRLAFGSLWRPESPELYLIGLRYWPGNAVRMALAAASRSEFGLLIPFLLYGGWRLWRDERHAALVLGGWLVFGAGLQFLYGPLRWRDLLAVLPALAILAAYGVAGLLRRLRELRGTGDWAQGWAGLAVAMLLAWRTGPVLAWPRLEAQMTFGYMVPGQRQAFDRLASLVEPEAVIGSGLNSGPVELYTGRQAFRPGDWSAGELEAFLGAMALAGRPAYILDDGNEQAGVVARLRREGRLTPVAALNVPLYGEPGQLSGTLYRIDSNLAPGVESW